MGVREQQKASAGVSEKCLWKFGTLCYRLLEYGTTKKRTAQAINTWQSATH